MLTTKMSYNLLTRDHMTTVARKFNLICPPPIAEHPILSAYVGKKYSSLPEAIRKAYLAYVVDLNKFNDFLVIHYYALSGKIADAYKQDPNNDNKARNLCMVCKYFGYNELTCQNCHKGYGQTVTNCKHFSLEYDRGQETYELTPIIMYHLNITEPHKAQNDIQKKVNRYNKLYQIDYGTVEGILHPLLTYYVDPLKDLTEEENEYIEDLTLKVKIFNEALAEERKEDKLKNKNQKNYEDDSEDDSEL